MTSIFSGIPGLVALLFFSGSFIFWNISIDIGIIAVFLFSLVSLPFLYRARSVTHFQTLAALVFLTTMLVLYLPFRPFSGSILGFALPLTVGLYFIFDSRYLEKAIYVFSCICAISAVSSLAVLLLNLVGFDPPHVVLSQDFRQNAGDFYKLYPGSIFLNTQLWQTGLGNIVRTSGIFREPGHYAMICSALLIFYHYRFEMTIVKLLVLGGVLTFSPAFIIMTVAGVALNLESKQRTKSVWLGLSIFFLIALFLQFAPQTLLDRLIYNNLMIFSESGLTGVLDQRARGDIAAIYDSLSAGQRFIGIGSLALETLGLQNVQSSDYRSFVIGYGFISFLSIILFYYWVGRRSVSRSQALVIIIFLSLLFFHRSWMLSQMWVHLIIISYCLVSYRKGEIDQSPPSDAVGHLEKLDASKNRVTSGG